MKRNTVACCEGTFTKRGQCEAAAVIAATAIAALIQLRHMRAGNAINAMLTLRSNFSDAQFSHAMDMLRGDALATAMRDPQFRAFVARKGPAPSDAGFRLHGASKRRHDARGGRQLRERGRL